MRASGSDSYGDELAKGPWSPEEVRAVCHAGSGSRGRALRTSARLNRLRGLQRPPLALKEA